MKQGSDAMPCLLRGAGLVDAWEPGRRLQSLDRRSWSGRPRVRVETRESTVCVEDEGHGRKGGAGLLS